MARRADHTPEELRELAIKAGVSLIEERGYSEFSARAVAAKIGYTVGTLYHIFGSLEEFVLHINARTLDLWWEEFQKALSKNKRRAVQTLARTYIDFCRKHPNRWNTLYEHRLPDSIKIPEWYEAKMDRLFSLVEESLKRFTTPQQAKRSAKILWAGIHGLCVLSLSGKLDVVGAESAEVLAKDLIDNYLGGQKRVKRSSSKPERVSSTKRR